MPDQTAGLMWRRSTFCPVDEDCVEVALLPDGGALVRDSKDAGAGHTLAFNGGEWTAFVNGAKAGEFNPNA